MQRLTLKNHIKESQLFSQRLLNIVLLVSILVIALFGRLVYLQVFQKNRYVTLAKQNQLTLLPISPARGLIYDRNHQLIAENIPVFNLEVTPNRVSDLATTLSRLENIIAISPDELKAFHKQLKQSRSFEPVPLKLKLSDEEMAKFAVNRHEFPGVDVRARLIRNYPKGFATAHVLGYVGRINAEEAEHIDPTNYRATNFIGKIGIERYYEQQLHGVVGFQHVETDASGRVVRTLKRTPPIPGSNLVLTIDASLQQAAVKALGHERGAIVAIDPNNGEVLALVSTPSFDPNLFVRGISSKDYAVLNTSSEKPLYNRAIRGQYPLASTIKPFIALQGLDSNTIDPSYRSYDPGWYKIPNNNHVYRSWMRGGHGWVNLRRALIVSCDHYFYNLAYLMGIDKIDDILLRFGFGEKTAIDLIGEQRGIVASPDWKLRVKGRPWYTGDTVNAGIGQGFMLSTPLQLANATAALASRGKRFKPHLLRGQQTAAGETTINPVTKLAPVGIEHQRHWRDVIKGLAAVISHPEGTGFRFGRDSAYTVAAKTGTAQVFSIKQHQQLDEANLPKHLRDHSLFIAFAPVKHPKIAVAVVVENSNSASPIARKVIDHYLVKESAHAKS